MTLSEYLKATKATQRELAEAIGSDVSAISLWASGERHPATYFALRIEAATGGAVPVTSWPTPEYARSSPHRITPAKSTKRGRNGRSGRKIPAIKRNRVARTGATK